MTSIEHIPVLSSDFDGTAVQKFGMTDRRNWTKSDLPLMPGYREFLRGFRQSGGILGDIVTARKAWRRKVTIDSLAEHMLTGTFADVIFAGNENKKAASVLSRLGRAPQALADDHPEKVGMSLLNQMSMMYPSGPAYSNTSFYLAVAPHPNQTGRIDKLKSQAEMELGLNVDMAIGKISVIECSEGVNLVVATIEEYSADSGEWLAELMKPSSNFAA